MKLDMNDLLPKLRQIGFRSWDPLSLSETWASREPMADEYDRYLMSAFGRALDMADFDAVCEVLREAEVRMGFLAGGPNDSRENAAREILELGSGPIDLLEAARSA